MASRPLAYIPFQTVKSASVVNALPQASASPRVQASARLAMIARIAASSLARVGMFCAAARLHRITSIATAASILFVMVSPSIYFLGNFHSQLYMRKIAAKGLTRSRAHKKELAWLE